MSGRFARRALVVCAVLASCLLSARAAGDDGTEPPREPRKLKAAKSRYESAVAQAEKALLKARAAALEKYLEEIEAAIKQATKDEDLDEAIAINAVKKQVAAELELAEGALAGKKVTVVRVAAAGDWQPALKVRRGERVLIRADGKWQHYPGQGGGRAGIVDANGVREKINTDFNVKAPYGALIGRFGDTVFAVGKSLSFRAPADGELELRINDKGTGDNSGELVVTIVAK